MLTKTRIALAAMIVAATSSVALAQEFDPNLANRYPAYADPVAAAPRGTFQSAPVRMLQGRNVALPTGRLGSPAAQPSPFEIDRSDRASSPYAGGGF
jgi:hypothetical protein